MQRIYRLTGSPKTGSPERGAPKSRKTFWGPRCQRLSGVECQRFFGVAVRKEAID